MATKEECERQHLGESKVVGVFNGSRYGFGGSVANDTLFYYHNAIQTNVQSTNSQNKELAWAIKNKIPCPSVDKSTQNTGLWSEPSTWNCGSVPEKISDVMINLII